MLQSRTVLHVFESGIVTGVRYRDSVLEPYVRLFRGTFDFDFIVMDDNAQLHRALLVDDFVKSDGIYRMDCPAKCPNLNPIEHIRTL